MEHLFSINKKSAKGMDAFYSLDNILLCSISSTNIIAFTTKTDIEENTIKTYGCHIYVADLNTPWQTHKILSSAASVTVLQWDFSGDILLIADESGNLRLYQSKDHLLNEWHLALQTTLQGEHILAAALFHSGKRIYLNSDKKDNASYTEKFVHVKFACSVKQFGGKPAKGALLLTTTGMLAALIIPNKTTPQSMTMATESLGPTRTHIKTADICYGKNGHFLLAVSSGDISMPIQCYKVTVRKSEEKAIIVSESLPSFFVFEGNTDGTLGFLKDTKRTWVRHLNWVMREDADSLVVAASNDCETCLQVWELCEKSLHVHDILSGGDQKIFNTVLWQYQSSFQYKHRVMSLATSKLTFLNTVSSSYIVAAFSDNSIHCLYRDTLKPICNANLSAVSSHDELPASKIAKTSPEILHIDISWLGNILLVIDVDSCIHVFKLPPQIDSSMPLSIPYCTTILEYCLMSGLDWLDLLLVLRPTMLDALCDRFSESFNRQTPSVQQFFYIQYTCIKSSLYRLTLQGQSKANDLSQFLMLHSIATAFKSLLRPSDMTSHDKSPADCLSAVLLAEGQNDVDKVLMNLEVKDFTVEPSTLQSLQQLIQWVADLALNLLVKLPESRPPSAKSYELLREVKALNMLREMLVLIRMWGLIRLACLPVFTKSDGNSDVLALIFKLLSRLVQNVNEPDENLIDDCCLLPNQVQIVQLAMPQNRTVLASHQLYHQNLPLYIEFQMEPDCLITPSETSSIGQTVDSIRHLFLGKTPKCVKQCVRCGGFAGTVPVTRTAAIRAWDQRWSKSCQCGGLWRMQVFN